MGKYKDEHGKSRVGDILRSIGKSDIIEKAIGIAGNVASGNYLGAIKTLVSKDSDITPVQLEQINKEIELEYQDRADARALQVAALNQDDLFSKRFLYYFALGICGFSMGIVIMLFFVEIPESNQRIVDMILGVIIGSGLISVINFFFGSSKGSKDKTDLLGK
jgi:hypothetical protein